MIAVMYHGAITFLYSRSTVHPATSCSSVKTKEFSRASTQSRTYFNYSLLNARFDVGIASDKRTSEVYFSGGVEE